MTTDINVCPHCGRSAPAGALAGLCPACLLRQGVAGDTVSPMAFTPPPIGNLAQHFPQLEILDLIGAGGMGAVYKARQRELDRIVALKILPPGIGDRPGFAERFTREAKALAKLSHPGIVTIHDTGRADGLYFLLMEFVDGLNLRQLLDGGRVSSREALAIVPQICDALQYAHDAGVVHRDIKPENILLDRQGRVKVADFGLAKLVGADETDPARLTMDAPGFTEIGHVMGTPQYMAPEQIQHPGDVDHRADIYSLGVVFYQMLTGELPDRILEPPSRKVQLDVRLDEVVLRALEKNPEHRYQQASQVGKSVETIINTSTNPNTQKETPVMDIKFHCPKCNQKIAVDETAAGAGINCPACSEPLLVPDAPAPRAPVAPAPQAPWAPRHSPSPPVLQSKRARGLAIWSLVLALIGLVPVFGLATGLVGLLLGIIALAKGTTSKGLAVAGTVIGCLAALMIPLHLGLLKTSMSAAKFATGTAVCSTNLKSIGIGLELYRSKHNAYPPNLEALVREGMVKETSLRCPLHAGKDSYGYSRPSGPQARGIIAWDRVAHTAVGNKVVGRNVLKADLSVQFLTEQQFQSAPRAGNMQEPRVARPEPPVNVRPNPQPRPSDAPEPPQVKEEMTLESAIASLATVSPREKIPPLRFLSEASVTPERRGAVISAVRPLLDDVDCGEAAFQAFAKWADKEQVPDLVEMVRVAPKSHRGKQAMNLLSRMGDARAAGPIAACLSDFHILRDAKAALTALGDVAKPAVLPLYHDENRHAREAARELLRGYNATDEEILAESIKALAGVSAETRRSAIEYLTNADLPAGKLAEVARGIRPHIADEDRGVHHAARTAMKKLATTTDADFLLETMQSTDKATRDFATDLLIQLKDVRVAKPLAALLPDPHETYRAGNLLIKLGESAEPAVIPYLRNEEVATRRRAADVLAQIGTAASLPDLEKAAKDKDFFAKSAAATAIAKIKARRSAANGR